ncbi:hypothetical protein OEZ86_005015 [Tetradesmus obliquus]|nr:hypothetical protein OEZ86_005015 [Tetradesmus obliquus]
MEGSTGQLFALQEPADGDIIVPDSLPTEDTVAEDLACQVANLRRVAAAAPFSWHMPQASVPGNPEVQAFLQGPKHSYTLSGSFSGIDQARKAAGRLVQTSIYSYGSHRCYGQTRWCSSNHSATVEAHGTGRNAHVAILKTDEWHKALLKTKQGHAQELQAVKLLLRKPAAAAAALADVLRVADTTVDTIDLTSD